MILHGDCLEQMKNLADNSVDMVLADPPYGTTACKWDSVIPFEPMWAELKRVTKSNAAICLFGSEPFSSHLRMSNIDDFKYDWIWNKTKTGGAFMAKHRPLKNHEIVSVFGKMPATNVPGNTMKYYPQGLSSCDLARKNTKKNRAGLGYERPSLRETYSQSQTGYPRSVLRFNSESNTVHATQKPVDLLEYLIKTYTIEGETVLDFCAGSGSTLVAAKRLGRKFIGIEREAEYIEIIKKRVEAA